MMRPATTDGVLLRRHILWLLLIRVILFTLLLAVTTFLQSRGHAVILPESSTVLAFLSLVYIVSIGSAAILPRNQPHIHRFGLFQVFTDTLLASLLIYGTGCSQSIFTPVYIFPIIAGGLILYQPGGLIGAAASTLLYGAVLTGEYFGYLPGYFHAAGYQPESDPLAAANVFAVHGVTFFTAALLSGLLAGRLRSAEEALSRTSLEFDRLSQLYKQIFDDIETGIITTAADDTITSCNRAAGRITGFEVEEIVGQKLTICFPTIRPSDKARQVCDLQRKDGRMIRVGYSFSPLNMPPDPESDQEEGARGKVITLQDISKIEKMEQQVREAEKMAAIGELSAAIAHDFRNPLAAISGSAQILAMELGSGQEDTSQSLTEIILRESGRMAKTITDFLQFARPAPLSPEWFDLARLIQESVRQVCVPEKQCQDCRVEVEVEENLGCWGDRQQIQTIICHLLENSCSATREREDRQITIRARETGEQQESVILIEVADNGPGIGANHRERIFAPFFSTRTDGTGLGLAIVRQILELHQGEIEVVSEQGKGCLMRVTLPLPVTPVP